MKEDSEDRFSECISASVERMIESESECRSVGAHCQKMSYLSRFLDNIYQIAGSHLKSNTAVFWCGLHSESSRQSDLSLILQIFPNPVSVCTWGCADMFTRWILTSPPPSGKQRSIGVWLYWSQQFSLICRRLRYKVRETTNGAPTGPSVWCPPASLSRLISIKNNEVSSSLVHCLCGGADLGEMHWREAQSNLQKREVIFWMKLVEMVRTRESQLRLVWTVTCSFPLLFSKFRQFFKQIEG